jgi:tRNA A37 threonylcarbamoyladenosine modification protein TsaB
MFAGGSGAELFGIVSLDAIAKQEFAAQGLANAAAAEQPLLVTSDARRSEHYWALYSGFDRHGVPICIEGPAVNRPADIEASLTERGIVAARTSLVISARAIGELFEGQAAAGALSHDITALYLRNPDAVEPKNLRDFGKKVSG